MRKMKVLTVLIIVTVLLAGCRKEQEITLSDKEEIIGSQEEAAEDASVEAPSEEVLTEDIPENESKKSSTILEDEKFIYLCGEDCISKVNKEDNTSQILWRSGEATDNASLYSMGSGLLLQDKIYFIERLHEEDYEEPKSALSVINIDGTGHKQLTEIETTVVRLYWKDQVLYVYYFDNLRAYKITDNGNVEEIALDSRMEQYKKMQYPWDGEYFSLPESLDIFGFLLVRDDENSLVKVDAETGEKTVVLKKDFYPEAYNENYLLSIRYEGDMTQLYLTDMKTLETNLVAECQRFIDIVGIDDAYVYTGRDDAENEKYVYERISLNNKESQKLFEQDRIAGMSQYRADYLFRARIQNDFLYYADASDYKMYIMRRSLKHPETQERIGDAYYDSRISEVGRIETYREKIYSQVKPEFLLLDITWERLVADQRFPGAEKINQALTNEFNEMIAYTRIGDNDYREEELAAGEEAEWMHYSYDGSVAGISYFDGNYFSFYQSCYEYQGGAHGMPFWKGHTFNLQTGDELFLKDVIGNSEEELKEIVTKYFADYINKMPDAFWPDAVDSVRAWTSYDSNFFLTEKGIEFYFGPYDLAAYAFGFQEVIIPYDEFDMKILLQ